MHTFSSLIPPVNFVYLCVLVCVQGWAAGGELDIRFVGHFWHTTNAGKTWTLETVPHVYGNDMSFVNKGKGWATAFTADGESAVLAYK